MIEQYLNARFLRRRLQHLLLVITVVIGVLIPSLPAQAETFAQVPPVTSRHPDAGIWVMYKGKNTVADLQKSHIKGVMAYAPWNVTYTKQNTFNWYSVDKELDFIINKAGKRAMLDVTVGYCPSLEWPAWMRAQVASHKVKNSGGCYPLQFWDPVYINLHKAYITAVADHLAQFDSKDARPAQTDITFVRAEVMAVTMENMPNDNEMAKWEWQDFNPAPNGRIHKVNLTNELKYAYHEEITMHYQRELARAYGAVGLTPPVAAAKSATYWKPYPSQERLVNAGVWLGQQSGSPNPQGWYFDFMTKVRSGATRGTSEAIGKSPETLLGQYAYWEVLANLHYGIEFIGIYGNNKFSPLLQPKGAVSFPENQEAMEFGGRYAGHFRNPALSPGAWIALRGGYPEDSFGGTMYARHSWTNYEFLMTQYRPQDSVVLFSKDHPASGNDVVTPLVKRSSTQPHTWASEIPTCQKSFSVQACEYLTQQPDTFVRLANGNNEYTFRTSDLGKVVYCGPNMFCATPTGVTRSESILWARRTNGAGGTPFMRFNLNDTYTQSLGGSAQIRVVYLDQGTGQWELRYDSTSGAEKSAIVVKKGNSNQWKEVVLDLSDVAFTNRQEGGTDLSLYNMGDDDDTFHMVEVTRAGTISGTGEQVPPDEVVEQEPIDPALLDESLWEEESPADQWPPEEVPADELPEEESPLEEDDQFEHSLHLPTLRR